MLDLVDQVDQVVELYQADLVLQEQEIHHQ
jgi:hypothetical protein